MTNSNKKILNFDCNCIHWARHNNFLFARLALFIVYFWFGILKVLELSPASPLVSALLSQTMPFIAPATFIIVFGFFEVIIGILFLIKHLERLAILALFLHLVTTVMPLFLLPELAWQGFLTPTLEGQYIIKNVLIVLAGIVVLAHLQPYKKEDV